MSNTTSEHPVTPAAISVGSDGSPGHVLRHTPDTSAARDNAALPEILHPIYDSTEQEREVKLAVVLAILDQLYAATAGKWILVKVRRESWIATTTQIVGNIVCEPPDEWENSMRNWPDNCAWIIAAHNHYPALRAEIERLREQVADQVASNQLNLSVIEQLRAELKSNYDLAVSTIAELRNSITRRSGAASWEEAFGDWNPVEEAAADCIKRLQSQLATAKRDGAVEELRRLADERYVAGLPGSAAIRDRADELEGK